MVNKRKKFIFPKLQKALEFKFQHQQISAKGYIKAFASETLNLQF